ncbi:MAG: hypothetical protein NTV01_18155 [Bacteroidia bacterium]|nr:hypothetical protein [Bacteroidia bacterium]
MKINNFKSFRLFSALLVLAGLLCFYPAESCTTAIVSGKYTRDGRPLLLKHRDTDALDNKLVVLTTGRYRAIALIDSNDKDAESIWIGFNETGFAIMNSASYNLNFKDTSSITDQEGVLMKRALLECSTVEEFEEFLSHLPKPLGVEANFGVIDARGGAAYFETGNSHFTKIDVNDPKIAPHGHVVRTNYSYTGDAGKGAGYIRYQTAESLFYNASGSNNLSADFILTNISRCVKNSLTGEDILDYQSLRANESKFMYFQDCTVRPSSASSVVIQGILPGETPGLTTMWTILGFPLSSVAIPVWLTPDNLLPTCLTAPPGEKALLCSFALDLKKRIVPITRSDGKSYLQTTAVINADNTGILQQLQPLEKTILAESDKYLRNWRKTGVKPQELAGFYKFVDGQVAAFYPSIK